MRKILVVITTLMFLSSLSYAQSKKERLRSLEERVSAIEEVIRGMTEVSETVDKNVEFYVDNTAPAAGEGKVVQGTPLVLDACDATTQWSVQSGAGVTISLDGFTVYEGTGSIRTYVPAGITAVVTATKSSGSWDLSSYKFLKVYLMRSNTLPAPALKLYFGETTYNEQNSGTLSPTVTTSFYQYTWDISGIAAASKNAVTKFSVEMINGAGSVVFVYIDYVFAEPGYGKFQAGYSERTATLSPPYVGTYTATATDPRTISVPRAGQIKALLIVGDDGSPPYFATSDMAGKAKKLSGTIALDSNQITSLGDGSFTVTGTMNNNGTVYYYRADFED